MTRSICALLLCLAAIRLDAAEGDIVNIRLVDALDEPEFYCVDIAGWAQYLKPEDPLQAHTCKGSGGADQHFIIGDNRIHVLGSDRCLEIAGSGSVLAGAAVLARTCSDSPLQNMRRHPDGRIEINRSGMCLTVGAVSADASGPSHVWRVLMVNRCEATPALATWEFVEVG